MPIATYPRPGKRIAPHSLAGFLNETIPAAVSGGAAGTMRLRDLDASAWARLGDAVCRRATREVVAAVARRIHAVGKLRFGVLPERLEWDGLDLGVRAHRAITWRRKLPRPASLSGWPLAEVMKIKAFGVTSLLDLLVALEDATGLSTVVECGQDQAPAVATCGSEPGSGQTDLGVGADDVLQTLPALLESRLRGIPERLRWTDLEIRVRTHNALATLRGMPRPAALNGMSIRDLMRSKNFGRESLRDLLAALASAAGCSCLAPRGPAPGLAGQLGLPLAPETNQEDRRRSLNLAVWLMRLEQALGPDVVHARDPRFGPQVRAVAPGCSDTSELLVILSARLERGTGHETRLTALQVLCSKLSIARGHGLLAELEGIVRSVCTDTHAKIALRLWGWDGRGGATLQQVGDEHGISRERVRQITDRAKEQLKARGCIFAPTATRTLEIAQGMLPAPVSRVAEVLAAEGLVPLNSNLAFLADLGRSLGRPPAFRFDDQYGAFVSTRTGENLVGEVHRQASRLASTHGAACVEDVCDALRTQATSQISPDGVSRLLQMRADLVWLDDERLWFCKRRTGGNLLLKRVHKVVAVAGRVRISELRGGVTRDYHFKGSVPPRAILLRLCGHDPALEIEGEVVATREGAALAAVLSPPEKTLWRVLVENGPVLERSQLERACLAAGLSRSSYQSVLTYSPIVIRYAPQVYGLRGVAIAPGTIESIVPPRGARKGRLLLDSGWAGDGRVRLVYHLSKGCVSNGIVTIPVPFARFLKGDFRLLRVGNPVGTLRCRGAQGWGLGPLFRRVGAEAGDTLTLVFDLQKSEAHASLTAEAPEAPTMVDPHPEAGVPSAAARG